MGDTKKAAAAIAAAAAAPQFVSSEVFMHLVLREANVRIGRFPNVAFLTCCSMNYEGTNVSARQCFAKACRCVEIMICILRGRAQSTTYHT